MEILHIFKSKPDSLTEQIVSELSKDKAVTILNLYDADVDWDKVVDAIFSHSSVISWW